MPPRVKREPTPPENGQQAVEEPNPDYLALPIEDRQQIDDLLQATQQMQDSVDKAIGVMGEPVFFMARLALQHELAVRALRTRCEALEARLHDLESRVS